ncbi:hypothetical protein K1T71_008607 [Dendrolimus kikuchii]|uniref:Uncharacterized protein n=1 Tax=Dendrolimus kikuchii TaxID=765133 RepID=A0ACC1CUY3_9NEOP|nr:hypothetical protein K1T71_008607 [Dendrolimus kikuchii]
MAEIGFKEIDVRCKQMLYYYDSIQAFRETTKSINPFHIPDSLYEEFIDDYVDVARDMRLTKNTNGSTVVMMKYNLIVVFGRK